MAVWSVTTAWYVTAAGRLQEAGTVVVTRAWRPHSREPSGLRRVK
jgi:hypothetical protein